MVIEIPSFFGEWLRQRRTALDLTRAELARCAGCSVSALRKIEAGDRRPSKQLAGLLAGCLHIPADEQTTFVRSARGELRVERLGSPIPGLVGERQRPVSPSSLPLAPTPLVGRESELDALGRLLHDGRCRLLTVVGTGGIGKTRLAIEVASRQRDLFADGAHFVPLAPLNSPAYLVPAIADALHLSFQGQAEPRMQLLNHLRDKQALLVLDNVEHLLDGVGLFAELLERAPTVRLLVTSRERLNLQGEWVFEIQGLPVPAAGEGTRVEEYSSVALFVQSARRARVGFELHAEERSAVVRICQAVEGMPLGIELAAAWVSVLACPEIAHEIERGLDFLTSAKRDVPERQQSLRAVFDHSWSLLSTEERRVLARLAIFQGGFGREAAAQVAGATLPILLALVSKSLVRRAENGRYDLHEVVRQYALSHLAKDPQGEATRDRHGDFYLALLREREAALKSAGQREALQELTDEVDNLRSAWVWAVRHEKIASIGQALRCFGWFHEMRGWYREGVEQVELAVQVLRTGPEEESRQRVLGQALGQQGLLRFRQGRFDRALALFEESLTLLRPIGEPDLLLDSLTFCGIVMFLRGEVERAQSLVEESLACARAARDPWFEAYALYNQGSIAALPLGQHAKAYGQLLEGLRIWRALGDPRAISLGLNWISPTAIKIGRYDEAQAYLEEGLELCTQVGDRWGIGTAYRHLGVLALVQGNALKAQSLLYKSLDTFAGSVTGWDVVQSLIYLGEATATAGDPSQARQIYLDALQQANEAQATSLALDVLTRLGDLQAQAGHAEQALELPICVLNHPASTQETKDRATQLRTQVRTQLAPQQIQAIEARSQARSFETLVAELLDASPA